MNNTINLGGYALPVISRHGLRQHLYSQPWTTCPKTGVTYQQISRYKSSAPKHLSDRNAECYTLKIDSALSPSLYFQTFRDNGFLTIEAIEISCPYAGKSTIDVLLTFVDEEQRDYTVRDTFHFEGVGGLFHKRIAKAVEAFQESCKTTAERFQAGWNGNKCITEIINIVRALNVEYTYGRSQLVPFTKAIVQYNDENNNCFGLAEYPYYYKMLRSGEEVVVRRSDIERLEVGGIPNPIGYVDPARLQSISELFEQELKNRR